MFNLKPWEAFLEHNGPKLHFAIDGSLQRKGGDQFSEDLREQ